MTPLESELLQDLGVAFWIRIEQLSFFVFFYGASLSLAVYGPPTGLMTGVFIVIFFASLVIFAFVLFISPLLLNKT